MPHLQLRAHLAFADPAPTHPAPLPQGHLVAAPLPASCCAAYCPAQHCSTVLYLQGSQLPVQAVVRLLKPAGHLLQPAAGQDQDQEQEQDQHRRLPEAPERDWCVATCWGAGVLACCQGRRLPPQVSCPRPPTLRQQMSIGCPCTHLACSDVRSLARMFRAETCMCACACACTGRHMHHTDGGPAQQCAATHAHVPVRQVDEAVLVVRRGHVGAVLAHAQHARRAVRVHRHVHLRHGGVCGGGGWSRQQRRRGGPGATSGVELSACWRRRMMGGHQPSSYTHTLPLPLRPALLPAPCTSPPPPPPRLLNTVGKVPLPLPHLPLSLPLP